MWNLITCFLKYSFLKSHALGKFAKLKNQRLFFFRCLISFTLEFYFKLSGPSLLHKSTSVCKMRFFFQAGVGRDWETVLENLQRLPPPPRLATVFHPKLRKLGMAVAKGHLQPGTVKLLSRHSAPQPPSTRGVACSHSPGAVRGRQRALLSAGNFFPLFLDGFSSPNPQKNCLAKIRKEKKKSLLQRKSLAWLLGSIVWSVLT